MFESIIVSLALVDSTVPFLIPIFAIAWRIFEQRNFLVRLDSFSVKLIVVSHLAITLPLIMVGLNLLRPCWPPPTVSSRLGFLFKGVLPFIAIELVIPRTDYHLPRDAS